MNIKARYCDTCNELMIDSDGVAVKLFLHLYKGVFEINVCSDCCEMGVNKPFEQVGFRQAYFKQQSGSKNG